MEWKEAKIHDNSSVDIPDRWLHLHYYESLNILFRFENSLRVFVYAILKNEFQEKWKTCSFQLNDRSENVNIKSIASRRISQAKTFGYLGYEVKSPLMHLTSGELVEIITNKSYWNYFLPYFKGSKEIIKNKLLEIGTVRNSLAHFRPIKKDDVELIKQNCRHTLISIDICLENLFNLHTRVPTNTSDDWYIQLSSLGNENIHINPLYSKDENWVNIQLVFRSIVLEKKDYSNSYFSYSITRLNTPHIIKEYKTIEKYITYLSESQDYPLLDKDFFIRTYKRVNLVFKKNVLENNIEEIAKSLKIMLNDLKSECDLLTKDHLARGKLLDIVEATAYYRKSKDEGNDGRWIYRYGELLHRWEVDAPDEYWGDSNISNTDMISGAVRYPWMPSEISSHEVPF